MKRLGFLLAAIFVSPEAVAGLVLCAARLYFPNAYSSLGENLIKDAEVWKYLPGLTLALSVFAIQQSFKLRAPLSNGNKILYEWPLYKYFVDRVHVCLGISILSAISAISLWVLGANMSPKNISLIFLLGSVISGITALTMLLAHQKLIEILETHGK